ncbi:MAG: replication-associated recombination protein A [Cytophagales bacterium]|nr:MAG: replication-associated recombination protein A [Cytophagales bacterium]
MQENTIPLAERMRPQSIDEIVGQGALLGKNGLITKLLINRKLPSMIFWGPPGVGKTTLAKVLAKEIDMPFIELSAINSGVKELRDAIDKATKTSQTILFIDEIHRFSKSQQDALLGAVEKGIILLIGATTENPSFEVINALRSRCQIYTLSSLSQDDLMKVLQTAITKDIYLKNKDIQIVETESILRFSGGDVRKLLGFLELAVESVSSSPIIIDNSLISAVVQQKISNYDKNGELHYDIISAFIKSIRGSDPNAAIYWLARMIEGGEQVGFIARRLVILASEDIGNANPTAIIMATNCFQAVNIIGYPESDIILAQCVTYLACSPKSNASYKAIKNAKKIVHEKGDLQVPLHLRNAPTELMKKLNYGKDYQYAHDFEGNFIYQEYMPTELSGYKFYNPSDNSRENEFRSKLKSIWKEKYGY